MFAVEHVLQANRNDHALPRERARDGKAESRPHGDTINQSVVTQSLTRAARNANREFSSHRCEQWGAYPGAQTEIGDRKIRATWFREFAARCQAKVRDASERGQCEREIRAELNAANWAMGQPQADADA